MNDVQRYHAVGKRKTAAARVYLNINSGSQESSSIEVNGQSVKDYFDDIYSAEKKLLKVLGLVEIDGYSIIIRAEGGGKSAQIDAAKLGIARVLVKYREDFKPILKSKGFMTRDARKVERKKPGLAKARAAGQWSKR